MKISPKYTSESKWFTQFTKRIKHMPWINEITYEEVKYLHERKYDPEPAAIRFIADHYNKDQ